MTKYFLHTIIVLAFLVSCQSEASKVTEPSNKLSQNDFKNLLLDVNLLEGYLTNLNVNLPAIKDTSLGQYKTIFNKYNLTYKEYKENYDYYIQQDNYKDILQRYSRQNYCKYKGPPQYTVLYELGQPHNRKFIVSVSLLDKNNNIVEIAKGKDCSKKKAEQMAAKLALQKMTREDY